MKEKILETLFVSGPQTPKELLSTFSGEYSLQEIANAAFELMSESKVSVSEDRKFHWGNHGSETITE